MRKIIKKSYAAKSITCILIFLSVVLLMMLRYGIVAEARIIYVGPGLQFKTIQPALDYAIDGDIVIVRDGIYTGQGNNSIDFKGKSIILRSENGAKKTILDLEYNSTTGIGFWHSETNSSKVIGLTIRNGKYYGIYCNNNSSPSIINCVITGNSKGGIHCENNSSPYITNCTISGNTICGIYCYSNSSPNITNCIITGNLAHNGGGIYCCNNSSPSITNCIITGNSSVELGGGICCISYSSPTIDNCTITGNSVKESGGGIHCYNNSSASIINSIIRGNSAGSGGGIYCTSSSPSITNCIITENSAGGSGGGICCYSSSSPNITNCTIAENSARGYGGGIYCSSSSSPSIINCTICMSSAKYGGGGIYCQSSSPSLMSCTISGNYVTGGLGGGIGCKSSSPSITNCILWADLPDEISVGDTLNVAYSDIQQDSGTYPGTGNINIDPLFLQSEQGTYYLKGGSPCIGIGTSLNAPLKDKTGIIRGAEIDMGAYEYVDPASCTPRASFIAVGQNSGIDPLTVEFDASSSGGSQFRGASFAWDFGDGHARSGLIVSHTYLSNGSYDVTLTITTDCGSHTLTHFGLIKVMSSKVTKEVGNGYAYGSIQEAIDDSDYGEYILVHNGIYEENITFRRKAITVCSENGADSTIIEGMLDGTAVSFYNCNDLVLEGFTIQNGSAIYGGGIYCYSSSPGIFNCIINGNSARYGGGIYCESSSPCITNCAINGNYTNLDGGGIYCQSSSPSIINSTISKNFARDGGGIYCQSSSPSIMSCTFNRNQVTMGSGGGISCRSSSPNITNCILWGDFPGEISSVETLTVTYSDIQQGSETYPGTGNINLDPLFVRSEQGNHYLKNGSPCIGSGTSGIAPLKDKEGIVRGAEIDMGAYEYVDPDSCTPRASFTVDQNMGIDPLTVEFDASSSGGSQYTGAAFSWDFGDGSTGSGLTVSHTFLGYGSYDVTLTISTNCGSHSLILLDLIKVMSSKATKDVGEGYAYSSIQEAIDDSDCGEHILVHDGTYYENIRFHDKAILLRSENGAASTIIDGNMDKSVVTFYYHSDSILDGFTIQNGSAYKGGGIYCFFSSPSIINCAIYRNSADVDGGGIYCYSSSPDITNCTISGNSAEGYGGGIYCYSSSPSIINCTISWNFAERDGGGIYCKSSSSPIITNSIFWGDFPDEILSVETLTVTYSDIQQGSGTYPGTGNINLDPLFVRSEQGNYYLKGGSPCIGTGTSGNAPLKDKEGIVRGAEIDMGAYEYVDPASCFPRASFTVDQNIGIDPLTVEFDASSSGGSQCMGATFSWDFGDGSTGSGLTVSHIYLSYGSYDVTLIISTDCGSHSLTLLDLIKVMSSETTKDVGEGYAYSSIQEAIDDSDCGEHILVHDGTYYENIRFHDKAILLSSENGAASSIIDGNMDKSVVTFYYHSDSILDGFTIQNGSANYDGGGIYCSFSSPNITNCAINNNSAKLDGGGIYCLASSPNITNCTISGNSAIYVGGIYCDHSSPNITNCSISENSGKKYGGGIYCYSSSPNIINCTISGNSANWSGGGIYCSSSSPNIIDCNICENSGGGSGGGIYCETSSPNITNCSISENSAGYGGGIYCKSSSLPNITNCTIGKNSANFGGGIYCDSSFPNIMNCSICENSAGFGGGIYCKSSSLPNITNCTISGNSGSYGGGIYCDTSSPNITNCSISENHAEKFGGGIYCLASSPNITDCTINENSSNNGSGIYCKSSSSPSITNCTISGNSSIWGSGIYCDSSSPSIMNCTMSKNSASYRGGIYCKSSSPNITNCRIKDNSAEEGGGICCLSSSPSIINCTITGNNAEAGGGIYCDSSSPSIINCTISENYAEAGGGICCDSSSPSVMNCTMSGNSAKWHGGGIYCNSSSSPIITNCIFWDDSPDEISSDATLTVTYSDIQQDSETYPGTGNINLDPLFLRSEQGNYYLKGGSPCMGAGTSGNAPLKDKVGIIRGAEIDMGAYEYVDPTSCTPRASFIAVGQNSGIDPLTVEFDASSSGGSQYMGAAFSWDFGDGSTGSGSIVPHTYSDNGSYDVTLTITTDCGSHSLILFDLIKVMSSKASKDVGEGYAYSSIQDAIDDSDYGEYILVHDGTYKGNIEFREKIITVCSKNGANRTIIDGDIKGSVVSFYNHSDSILDGFTIQNGSAYNGGGIYCSSSSPTIINCTIRSNFADSGGGGIYCSSSSLTIINCTIYDNFANFNGSGIYCSSSSPTITNCTISGNSTNEWIGGIYCDYYSSPNITNCILWDNLPQEISGGTPIITYTDIKQDSGIYPGTGNINVDPLFAGSERGIYYLKEDSPCIDAGTSINAPLEDKEGVIRGAKTDMGAYEFVDIDPNSSIPRALFNVDKNTGIDFLTVELDATSSGGSQYMGATFSWDFGDGSAASGSTVSHTYSGYGSYDVTLAITTANGSNSLRIFDFIKVMSSQITKEVGEGYAYSSIQDAIDDSDYGEYILVHDGTYNENIKFCKKIITVCSKNGANRTIIDGKINGSVVSFYNHSDSLLDGFTIRNGSAMYAGGISCLSSSPSIKNCIISENFSYGYGGGIHCLSSSPKIMNCTISKNSAMDGGGIHCLSSSPSITNCTINGNSARDGGGIYCSSSSPSITNCIISINSAVGYNDYGGYGGGIYCFSSSPGITNSIINGNSANFGGGGIYCSRYSSPSIVNCTISGNSHEDLRYRGGGITLDSISSPSITNSILWGNFPEQIPGYGYSNITINYSDIQQDYGTYPGTGNINADPLFMGIERGIYYLEKDSPCIDAGTSINAPLEDKEGVIRGAKIDMGAYEYMDIDPNSCIPRALFNVDHNTGIEHLSVKFDSSLSGASQYSGAIFSWDFGDGSTGSGLTVSHTYSGYGSYDVTLTITTECGSHSLTLFDFIKVMSSEVTKEVGEGYAYSSIQEAIDDSDCGDHILVHDGTYVENIKFRTKAILLRSENGAANTIIDGNEDGSVVSFFHHSDSILEGFTLQNGLAGDGGGIYCILSSPIIKNCTITGNSANSQWGGGGGIYCGFSAPSLGECTISGNSAENGGGIYCDSSSLSIRDSIIRENSAISQWGGGGGIYYSSGSLFITNSIFSKNMADAKGGGIFNPSGPGNPCTISNCSFSENKAGTGGGVSNSNSSFRMINCTFNENWAETSGGGIYNENDSDPNIDTCIFIGNMASNGGGMYNSESSPNIANCTFRENSANYSGGGIYNSGPILYYQGSSTPMMTNCVFIDNTAEYNGGGIYNEKNSNPIITNCTFKDNWSGYNGGGLWSGHGNNPVLLTNCILWGNSSGHGLQVALQSSTLSVSYCDLEGGQEAIATDSGSTINWGNSNIDVDPLFGEDYHLQAESPCRNVGDPNSALSAFPKEDIDGEVRPQSDCYDIGADEFFDSDGDGMPDYWEIQYVLSQYTPDSSQDPENDGLLNLEEYNHGADPTNPDTDGDGDTDGAEVIAGTNPLIPHLDTTRTIYYVDIKAIGDNDGTSWDNAFRNLQDALVTANAMDEIWVAKGTYKPDRDIANPLGNGKRTVSFKLRDYVAIYGGFSGEETSLDERDWHDHRTILSGDLKGDDNPNYVNNEENSYHVITCKRNNTTAILDGFIITGGNANGLQYPDNIGGGIYCTCSSPRISNCVFTGNWAGRYPYGTSGLIFGGYDSSNDGNGGGMYNCAGSPIVTNCIFNENSANNGGGIYNAYSSPVLTNCIFLENLVSGNGGGICNFTNTLMIANCTFNGNTADYYGGGIYNYVYTDLRLTNSILWGNSATDGPQIALSNSNLSISYCDLEGGATAIYTGESESYYEDVSTITSEGVNIDEEPLFKDGWHLKFGSPCRDAGDPNSTPPTFPSYDIDGEARPQGDHYDIGADEFYDSDGDGIPDYWEIQYKVDSSKPDASYDLEGDGLTNLDEYELSTDPMNHDTDGDCCTDGYETSNGTDPLDPNSFSGISTIHYVNANAFGKNDGTSWENAFRNLQDALAAANPMDEIWVAKGIYRPDQDKAHSDGNGDRTASFEIKNCIAIYGGFSGVEAIREDRNWRVHQTILSGDLNGDDGLDFINNNENSYHVVTSRHTNTRAVLDGFIIIGGNADGQYPDNTGGGMYNYISNLVISNCIFKNNSADFGGGMHNSFSSPSVTNCIFMENLASSGGGMDNWASSPSLNNCIFNGNSANYIGGGMYNRSFSSPSVTNCTFTKNSADNGGGMYNYYGSCSIVINSVFWGNISSYGPQVALYDSNIFINYCDIEGGRMALYSGGSSIINWGTANINEDPLFEDDYHLYAGSPCIDTGDPASDLLAFPNEDIDGEARPHGLLYDIGADEFYDSDEDTIPDYWEIQYGLKEDAPDEDEDKDRDGLTNIEEYNYGSNPTNPDMDGDGYKDGQEVSRGTDPFDLAFYPTPKRYYVDIDATGSNDGSNWNNAFKNLQDALAIAEPVDEIWVAEGVYRPDRDNIHPDGSGDRTASFDLKNGVAIYGGFSGTELSTDLRDWQTHQTILSGDLNGDDGPDFANNHENSFHILTTSGVDPTTILDGFIITTGNANGSSTNNTGGGMYNCFSSSPTVKNCTFKGNYASQGGGIYNDSAGNPLFTNCTFSENSANNGGGIYNYSSIPTIINCIFTENSATSYGGGMNNYNSSPIVLNCIFCDNSANIGGALCNSENSNLMVSNCLFSENAAESGGGIYDFGGTYDYQGSFTVVNCTFKGNSASEKGGGIGISYSHKIRILTNCILWGNTAPYGPQLSIRGSWGSTSISYSNLEGGQTTIYADPSSTFDWGDGNIEEDPLFYDDYHLYAASPCRNAGDPASAPPLFPDYDLDSEPRPHDGRYDMGADEFYDNDDDGMPDYWEIKYGLDHHRADAGEDPESDLLINIEEYLYGTNPNSQDTDGDGFIDTEELSAGTNPTDPDSIPTRAIYYVDPQATGNNHGWSWDNAFKILQDALAIADSGDEIWVAEGTYRPDQDNMHPDGSGNRFASFELKNGVAIYGGFSGTETSLDQRDWCTYKTILSGDLAGDDGSDFANNHENSFHVVVSNSTYPTTILDGFIITAGNANGPSYPDNTGGGMYNSDSSPAVNNCIFKENTGDLGGGMGNSDSSPMVNNCIFKGNLAGNGGGMNNRASDPTVTNSTFIENHASEKGGIINNYENSSLTMTNSILWGNTSIDGDQMALDDSTLSIEYCDLEGGQTAISSEGDSMINWGAGNIEDDPQFEDEYHLYSESPCRNAGDPNSIHSLFPFTDIDGENRAQDGRNDIGADEFYDDDGDGMPDYWEIAYGLDQNNPDADDDPDGDGLTNIEEYNHGTDPTNPDTDWDCYHDGEEINSGTDPLDPGEYPTIPTIYYVNANATEDNDGTSWENAFRNLQDALAIAKPLDEIWVAAGVYKPDREQDHPLGSGDRAASFELENCLSIYGGFAGCETTLNQRDWQTYHTILSGDLNSDDGPDFTNNNDNSYHVITNNNIDERAILDGFIITAGNANGSSPDNTGGGMFNQDNGSPMVINCTFKENWANCGGGGMSNNSDSSPTVINCSFIENSSEFGGGVSIRDNSNPKLTNCTFKGNSATGYYDYYGSNLPETYCTYSSIDIPDCGSGGGIFISESSPTVANCTFRKNSAKSGGGGIYNRSGNPILSDCSFIENSSLYHAGGGIFIGFGGPSLNKCIFIGNSAHNGGGVYNNSNPTIINCIFYRNFASVDGGGMSNYGGSPTLINCTFRKNSAAKLVSTGRGGGMCSTYSSPSLMNCILWGNTSSRGPQISLERSTLSVNYCDLEGGQTAIHTATEYIDIGSTINWGNGNIEENPLFQDDYHLHVGSPCLNTGDPNSFAPVFPKVDIDGDTRPQDGRYDIGADEFYDFDGDAMPDYWEITYGLDQYNPDNSGVDIENDGLTNLQEYKYGTDPTNPDTDGDSYSDGDEVSAGTDPLDPRLDLTPKRLYVHADAIGNNDGSNWADAYQNLQDALEVANSGDVIWVAEGTYTPDRSNTYPGGSGDRTAPFALKDGIAIYGGFAGNENSLDKRDWQAYQTILSGDLNGDDDPNFINNGENSYHVVTSDRVGETTILDGFVITGGNANGTEPFDTGGGMYNMYSSPRVKNCIFRSNSAKYYGGGMENSACTNLMVSNCTFRNNSAGYYGGGIENRSGNPILSGCSFIENSARDGGGICNNASFPKIINCTFNKNSAIQGGGIKNFGNSPNTTYGPAITNCIFAANQASFSGGGMDNERSCPTIINCTFYGNSTLFETSHYQNAGGGGIMNFENSILTMINCILWNNTSANSNGMQIGIIDNSSLTISYSLVQGGEEEIYMDDSSSLDYGISIIDKDPLFLDPDGSGDVLGTSDDNLRLSNSSPCIDTGTNDGAPDKDMEGAARPYDGDNDGMAICDLGAFEFSIPLPPKNVFIISGNTIKWDANTEPNLAGYCLYYKTGSSGPPYDVTIDVGNVTTYTIEGLSNIHTYFFALTAYNTSNYHSDYSNEVRKGLIISSSISDGFYKAGKDIDITINFLEPVTLTGGNLIINLNTGQTITIGPFTNKTSLSGIYSIQQGDVSTVLNIVSLELSGGTLRNEEDSDYDLTIGSNLAADKTIVVDTINPVIICPEDITVKAKDDLTTIYYPPATISDNLDAHPRAIYDFPSGSQFHPGEKTVIATVADAAGNNSQCSFKIIVKDFMKPVPDIAELPELRGVGQIIITETPTATDNCAGALRGMTEDPLTYNAPGTYTINWVYDDGNGNITIQTQALLLDYSIMIDFLTDWSMISLPLIPDNASVSSLFPDSVVVYGYEKGLGYVRVAKNKDLQPGKGYWILLNQSQTYNITGQSIQSYILPVYETGWAMIGGCSYKARPKADNCRIGVIYRYVRGTGYQQVLEGEHLEPGQGYWIHIDNVMEQGEVMVQSVK